MLYVNFRHTGMSATGWLPTKATVLIVVLLVGVALSTVLVSAHGPGPTDGIIHACVNSNSGEIRLVDADATCKNNWVPLDWNQRGPAGPQGPPGPQGPTGPQGPAGEAGVAGYEIVSQEATVDFEPVNLAGLGVTCPEEKKVLGGGITAIPEKGSDIEVAIVSNGPLSDRTWGADLQKREGSGNVTFTVRAICANVE